MEQSEIEYKRIGNKTLAFFILQRLRLFFLSLLLIIALFFASRFIPVQYANAIAIFFPYLFLALIVFFAGGSISGWVEYTHYSLVLSNEDIKITRGLVSEEETGIPYRRIKEVKIERDVVDEAIGLSDVIIIIQGEEESGLATEKRVILPLLPKEMAIQIQNKILGKAEVEEMQLDK